jgi:methanol--5-hydroxybenzimidazolylcobamide Co-methyltransferase
MSNETLQMKKTFNTLAIADPQQLMFGRIPKPVSCGYGLKLGNGEVYPELNFTLPTMALEETNWTAVVAQYEEIGTIIERAAARLKPPGLMAEFELLPPMTEHPSWGAELTSILLRHLEQLNKDTGIPCALRVTPTDIRDVTKPPELRSGKPFELLMESFEQCAAAGAHVLSIESVGGKEVHDEALLYGDIEGIIFALGVLASRDMEFLWERIVTTCSKYKVVPGGDSACGFANTAMQLAGQGMLPEVLASVVRAASSVRSLVAYECGAYGPSKDCAYEGPVIKAITGAPIAMEGKSASCAHFSPVGNVAAAMCDLWSNESVQNVRLLSGPAPEAYLELLVYDCRLFNQALKTKTEKIYQNLLVSSDIHLSPQAYVLSPASTSRIASAIVRETGHYAQTLAAAREAVALLGEGLRRKELDLNSRETEWLERINRELGAIPSDEQQMIAAMQDRYGHLFATNSYGL